MIDQSKDEEATLQMMALVGEAITQWSFVEQTLSNIFTVCVVPCPTRMTPDGGYVSFIDSEVPTAIFYSTESFRGKLSLVDAALTGRIKSNGQWATALKDDWAKVREKTRKLSLKRNSLAHGTVTPAFTDDDQFYGLCRRMEARNGGQRQVPIRQEVARVSTK
ncbi:MAG: hypothetical protein V4521_02270 [Pseudomonadota bacterium]